MRKKKILFVINTLGRAGAEVALLSLFSAIDPNQYELSLYVMMGVHGFFDRHRAGHHQLCDFLCEIFGLVIWIRKSISE